jgi:hypothetical protein
VGAGAGAGRDREQLGQKVGRELQVACYSFRAGVPDGERTLYLEPYNETPQHPWKLLGGSVGHGVSHADER